MSSKSTNATLVKVAGVLTNWSNNDRTDRIEMAIRADDRGVLCVFEIRCGDAVIFRHDADNDPDPMEAGLKAIVKMAKDILNVPGVLVQDVMES